MDTGHLVLSMWRFKVIISQKFLNQIYLLFPFQLFNLIFPAHSFRLGLKFFKINQLYRTSAFCIFCALPRIVTGNPFFQIVCPSGIKTAVAALYHIRIIHLLLPYIYVRNALPKDMTFYISSRRLKSISLKQDTDCNIKSAADFLSA